MTAASSEQAELQQRGYLAPDGTTFVCGACGKHGHDRTRIGDAACFMNAVLCYNPPNVRPDGRPAWMAVPEGTSDA